jgi:hypothetical protein
MNDEFVGCLQVLGANDGLFLVFCLSDLALNCVDLIKKTCTQLLCVQVF